MHLETLEYTNTEYFFLPRQNANHFGKDIQSKHCMSITEHREREKLLLMCFRLQEIQHSANNTSEREGVKDYI